MYDGEGGTIVVIDLRRMIVERRWDNNCCVDLRRMIVTGKWDNMS